MTSEVLALIGLSITLLSTLLVSAWRFSGLATSLSASVRELEKRDVDLAKRDDEREAEVKKLASLVPKLTERVAVVEAGQKHSKEMRAIRSSWHDEDE